MCGGMVRQRLDEAANTGDAVTTASQASRPRGQFGLGEPEQGPDAPDRTVGLERRLIHEALAMGDNSPLPGGRLSETPDVRHRRKPATHYSARGAQSSPATRASAVPSGGAGAGADTPTPSRVVGALRYAQTPGPRLQHAGVDLLRRGGGTLPYSDGASRLRSSLGPDVSMARSYTLPGMDGALHTPGSGSRRTPAGLLSSGARRVSSGSAHVAPGMRRGSVGRSTLGTPHARLPATITMAGSPLVWAEQERATKAQEDFQQEARAVRRALAEVSLRDSKEEEGEGLREQVEAALINDGSQSLLDEEDQLQGVLVKHLMVRRCCANHGTTDWPRLTRQPAPLLECAEKGEGLLEAGRRGGNVHWPVPTGTVAARDSLACACACGIDDSRPCACRGISERWRS